MTSQDWLQELFDTLDAEQAAFDKQMEHRRVERVRERKRKSVEQDLHHAEQEARKARDADRLCRAQKRSKHSQWIVRAIADSWEDYADGLRRAKANISKPSCTCEAVDGAVRCTCNFPNSEAR